MTPEDARAGASQPIRPQVIRPLRIHYLRPPHGLTVFQQLLLLDSAEVLVSFAPSTSLPYPIKVDGEIILEDGSPVVWFTFPGVWHDIGRFHRADGTFTGIYANILTAPRLKGEVWSTVDLFLDLWLPPGFPVSQAALLDQEELEEAHSRGWISPRLYTRARMEARHLMAGAEAANWPPQVVEAWPLERCEAVWKASGCAEPSRGAAGPHGGFSTPPDLPAGSR